MANLDTSFMNLLHIRTLTLKPLRDYVRQAPGYQRLTPALRLYLSNNSLEEVPSEVYQLQNLEAMSLRNNILTEVLPSMYVIFHRNNHQVETILMYRAVKDSSSCENSTSAAISSGGFHMSSLNYLYTLPFRYAEFLPVL